MKRITIMAALMMAILPMAAQETYENAKIAGPQDLNGTARYVGMGGAMEALGADISTVSTNPAGIGLFRRSSATFSAGLVSQQDAPDFSHGDKTKVSFDQLGFVYATPTGSNSFVNFAFNYHKSRNFNFILSAADQLAYASQNKLTYAKAKNGLLYSPSGNRYATCSQLDDLYARYVNYEQIENTWYYDEADAYALDRSHTGSIQNFDFNISGNINDRVYLGVTFGLKNISYKHYGVYTEQWPLSSSINSAVVTDEREIEGTGFDMTFGAIFRPVEDSPFRVGLSVATPTFYDLTTRNWSALNGNRSEETYDFKLYTPWKFGVSLGHTVGTNLALGLSYDYSDYSHLDTRYNVDSYSWGGVERESRSDDVMNDHTKETLKGVSTLKLGIEYKPVPEMAFRLGYNYLSSMYDKNGFKDGTLPTDGSYYSSATDYTNWKSTNRVTAGFGYNWGNLSLDVAYQYSATSGNFEPFMSYTDAEDELDDNIADIVKVDNKRHQLLFTLGYRF